MAMSAATPIISDATLRIQKKLKYPRDQKQVVGPLVERLCSFGWNLDQIVFGKNQWLVPKTISAAKSREKGRSFASLPCDIAIFDSPQHVGNPRHLIIIIECKQPTEKAGVAQLQKILSIESHAKLGVWINNADPTAPAVFIYPRKGIYVRW